MPPKHTRFEAYVAKPMAIGVPSLMRSGRGSCSELKKEGRVKKPTSRCERNLKCTLPTRPLTRQAWCPKHDRYRFSLL